MSTCFFHVLKSWDNIPMPCTAALSEQRAITAYIFHGCDQRCSNSRCKISLSSFVNPATVAYRSGACAKTAPSSKARTSSSSPISWVSANLRPCWRSSAWLKPASGFESLALRLRRARSAAVPNVRWGMNWSRGGWLEMFSSCSNMPLSDLSGVSIELGIAMVGRTRDAAFEIGKGTSS